MIKNDDIFILLRYSNLTPARLILSVAAFASVFWIGVMLMYGMSIDEIEQGRELLYKVFPMPAWIAANLSYGFLSLMCIKHRVENDRIYNLVSLIVSTMGVLLFSFNVGLVLVSKLDNGTLSHMSTQWVVAIIAWWIFFRDCYGR